MKPMLPIVSALFAAVPMLALAGDASLRFTPQLVTEGAGAHMIVPFQVGDEMIVAVHDPIQCGQVPVQPRFAISDGRLVLQYDLREAPSGAPRRACTAHSVFQVSGVAQRDLEVGFAGGAEAFSVAQVRRRL